MKIIFLDIDGVLNSDRYDREQGIYEAGIIDVSRVALIKEIIDKTDAKVVLTSTWRHHWDKDEAKRDRLGKEIDDAFKKYNVEIYDKTPRLGMFTDRADEILTYMENAQGEIKAFVIVDDSMYRWDDLSPFFVQTNPKIGYGLEKHHVDKIVELLNGVGDEVF